MFVIGTWGFAFWFDDYAIGITSRYRNWGFWLRNGFGRFGPVVFAVGE